MKLDACEPQVLWACVEVGKLLTSTTNMKKILKLIIEKVSLLIHAENWSLLLLDEETGRLRFEVVVGEGSEKLQGCVLEKGQGLAGTVAETGEMLIIPDVSKDTRFNPDVDRETGFITRSIVCLPLKIEKKIIGVVEVVNLKEMQTFDTEKLPLLTLLADYAAIAIDKAQYISSIKKMSITDEYTGLYNARYLKHSIGGILENIRRKNSILAVVFVDIDNFKEIVDTYGHLSGSGVLREIGQVISKCLDSDDILVKYGGDEYVIILPHKTRDHALLTCEKILEKLRRETFLAHEKFPPEITASFGIAMYPEDAQDKEDLLDLADKRMYRIKKTTKSGISAK